jgi:hypothetical protein
MYTGFFTKLYTCTYNSVRTLALQRALPHLAMKASVSHFIYLPLHRSSQRKSSLERRSFASSRNEKGVRAILWKGIDFLFCFLLLGFHSCCVPLLAGRFLVCRCGRKDKNRRGRVQRKALVNNYPAIASYRIGSYLPYLLHVRTESMI